MASTHWTDEFLDRMRGMADPLADGVAREVIDGGSLEEFNMMVRHLVNNRDSLPESMHGAVRRYFEQTQALPEWADMEKIKRGEQVFDLYGPEMIMMLFFVSLPYAYATRKGSNVLVITAELTRHVHRRIFRTAQFIMDVMQSGGLGSGGRGVRSAQKVRLLHASIRHYISRKHDWQSKWDLSWGMPINQEDMAGTLMDFAIGVMRGMERAGIKLSPEEAEAYLHCWKVVGYVMGVNRELLPDTVEDARVLAEKIIARQMGPCNAGKDLTRDLIRFMQRFLPWFLKGFPSTAIRYLSGNKVADVVGSGPYNLTIIFLMIQVGLFKLVEWFKHRFPGVQRSIRYLTWMVIDKVVLYEEGGDSYFEIPDDLRRSWGLSRR